MSSGRGPTRLMSPRTTLTSSGSSSMLVRRRNRPSAVRRSCVGQERAVGATLVGHGAELRQLERSPVASRTQLAEQHRRSHAQRARARATTASSGDENDERGRRTDHVDDALQRVVTAHGTSRRWRAAPRRAGRARRRGRAPGDGWSRPASGARRRRGVSTWSTVRRTRRGSTRARRSSVSRSVRVPNARFTGAGRRDPAGDGVGDDLGDGVDEGEVAGLLPVAVHHEWLGPRARRTRTRAPPRRRRARPAATARTR